MQLFKDCSCHLCSNKGHLDRIVRELIFYLDKGLLLNSSVTLPIVVQSFSILQNHFGYMHHKLPYTLLYHVGKEFHRDIVARFVSK